MEDLAYEVSFFVRKGVRIASGKGIEFFVVVVNDFGVGLEQCLAFADEVLAAAFALDILSLALTGFRFGTQTRLLVPILSACPKLKENKDRQSQCHK